MDQNALMKKRGIYWTAVVMKIIAYSSVTYKYINIYTVNWMKYYWNLIKIGVSWELKC